MMRPEGRRSVGLTHVEVTLTAADDAAEHFAAAFLVDTGAIDSMAPAAELSRIGIRPVGKRRYELADGSVHEYAFGLAPIEFMGEITAGRVIFGPDGVEPILGATALESAGMGRRSRHADLEAPANRVAQVLTAVWSPTRTTARDEQ